MRISRSKRSITGILTVVASLCLLAATLEAQSFFGAIVGTVTDPSEAAVPAAAVTLTNTGTGETKTVEADAAGNYQFLNLIPGFYKVAIERPGFKRFTRDQVQVVVQSSVRVDVRLEVGDVGQAVEVNALAVSLQTESATL